MGRPGACTWGGERARQIGVDVTLGGVSGGYDNIRNATVSYVYYQSLTMHITNIVLLYQYDYITILLYY